MTPIKIAIIGAGANGLCCAVQLVEDLGKTIQCTIIADAITPNTTSDIAGGLWGPYLSGKTPIDKVLKWGQDSHDYVQNLWKTGYAEEVGISLVSVVRFSSDVENYDQFWKHQVYGWEVFTQDEIEVFNKDQLRNYKSGARCLTFTLESTRWLPFLMKKFQFSGGQIKRQHITSLNDIADDYDLIINCAGLYGGEIVNDSETTPIRGQIVRVAASWQFHAMCDDSSIGNHIIPNMESILLGGTHQYGDFNENLDPVDRKFVYNGCLEMSKSLKEAPILWEKVGLRPGRSSIRVEEDTFTTNSNKTIKLIHNYGHGGCGITLAWGCAIEVVSMVKNSIQNDNLLKSKI